MPSTPHPPAASSSAAATRTNPVSVPVNGSGPRPGAAAGSQLGPTDTFVHRHIGPSPAEIDEMLSTLGYSSLEELVDATVPASIRLPKPMTLSGSARGGRGEFELLAELREIAQQNKVYRSFIGMGYYDTITPPVILRNILENPGWYTQYTPYQAEISQGRLEALLNFQTMIADLTALPLAGASLLDEGTAAAEAMAMCFAIGGGTATRRRSRWSGRGRGAWGSTWSSATRRRSTSAGGTGAGSAGCWCSTRRRTGGSRTTRRWRRRRTRRGRWWWRRLTCWRWR